MKRIKVLVVALLLLSFLISGCGQLRPAAGAAEGGLAAAEEAAEAFPAPLKASVGGEPLTPPAADVRREPVSKAADALFRVKFEGSSVAGSGESVDGVYRVAATKTDGEAWHVKLESNYPTVAGRDYRVTYRFRSDVAGTVKFGDFQEFKIHQGDNSVTGVLIANSGTSYLDLQLGMLPPFTIDFSEVEVEEYADEVDYENALPAPVNFEREKSVFEKHDQGYAPVLTRAADEVSINYVAAPWDPGVWRSRLYVKTGLVPEAGVHYRITADVTGDEDMPFEILFNDGEIEKGYGALYGQRVTAGQVTNCEAVITGTGDGDELVLQFSLGEAPEESTVKVGNLRVEKITDHYTSVLPATFALNKEFATGKIFRELIPASYTKLPLTSFSYSSRDSVFEGHDDGYRVRMKEGASKVTMDIYQAPAAAKDRGVWKAKLYVDTGAVLEAGKTYKVMFDLVPEKDQAEYEICFDSDSKENAYGALYGRSLSAGTADHISYVITPTESKGALILRLQLGKTDSAAGNKFTFRNLTIESLPVSYSDILPADFSYDTPSDSETEPEYSSVLPDDFSYRTDVNVFEQHDDVYTQSVSADGGSATLNISGAPAEGRGVWRSKLLIHTGVTPQANTKYIVSFDVSGEKDQARYEVCFDGTEENKYGALYDQALSAGSTQSLSHSFTPDAAYGPLVLRFQLGETDDASGNVITVSNLKVAAVTGTAWSSVLPGSFAYPEVSGSSSEPDEGSYQPVTLPGLTASEEHDAGYAQTLSDRTLTISTVPPQGGGVWSSRLFVRTGVTPEPGATYRVTANVSSAKEMGFEILYDNGGAAEGYGAKKDPNIAAGATADFTGEFTVAASAAASELVLRFQLGNSPADNTFTVNSVTVQKVVPAHEESTTIPAAYQAVSSGLALSEACDPGYEQTLEGNTLTIAAVPDSDTGVWKSKLFADTGTTLEPGAAYRVTANVSSAKAMAFEICYNNGAAEKGYEALYGQSIGDSATANFVKEFSVAADASVSNLVLQFQLGSSPAGNSFAVNSVTIEKYVPEHEGSVTVPEATEDVPVSLSAAQECDAGYTQSLEGLSLTISAVPPKDFGVWSSRLFVATGVTPEPGEKYRVTAKVSSAKEMDFEILYDKGGTAEGYGAKKDPHIAEGATADFAGEFTAAAEGEAEELILRFQLGNSPAGNTFTVSEVSVEKWTEGESGGSETQTVDPGSFELWTHETYTAALSGDGSFATVSFTTVPGDAGVWKTKLFAETGVTLTAGKSYRISADVQATSEFDYEICYNDGGIEKGVDPTEGGKGAIYGLHASATAQTVTQEVTPDHNADLILQFSLGNAAAGSSVTVKNIEVEELGEAAGENLMTDSLVAWAPVHHWADSGYAVSLSNTDSSASADISAVPGDPADWKLKLFVETGAPLAAGKSYRIRYDVQADSAFDYNVFYNNGAEEKAVGEFYDLNTANASVEHTVSPGSDATLTIQLMLGKSPAPNHVTVSNVQVDEIVDGSGDGQNTPINAWAHEEYETSLSNTDSSASIAITKVPATGREAWMVKLFAETGAQLKAGRTYRVSLDVQAASQLDYEICYNNLEHEKALGAQYDLSASATAQTVTYMITPESDAVLTLQLNLGKAKAANTVTISGVKVEEVNAGSGTSVIPGFRYDSVGYIGKAADDGYVVELDQKASSADFRILRAPKERNSWNVKLNVKTGFTPEANKGYRVSFDITAAKPQGLFEVFYDGNSEMAYGAIYEQVLSAGKQTVSYIVLPGDSKGELSLQIRLGKTDGRDGNSYTISNIKLDEVSFTARETPEIKAVTELWTHETYSAGLEKTRDRATVRVEKTPATGREPWKTKLFVYTGVTLKAGQKYRVSMNVKSIIPAPFEVCYNNGDEEKGLGAMFGLISTPSGQFVEYTTYPKQDTQLVIQLSLGNCTPPNSIILGGLKLEKAGTVNLVSDTVYTF